MTIKCYWCGAKRQRCKSHYDRSPNKRFCSNICKAKFLAYKKSRSARTTQKCKTCNKVFSLARWQKLDHGRRRKYCSQKCRTTGAVELVRCAHCKVEIRKYRKRKSKNAFCCRAHFYAYTKTHTNSFGTDAHGYIWVRINGSNRIYQHRLVMEKRLGRKLHKHEKVHHKNGQRPDNRDSNLELWSTSHPAGQRVSDKIFWAIEFLQLYGYALKALDKPKAAA